MQGYKFELMPSGEQLRHLRRFAGSCRFVYKATQRSELIGVL
jgi:putative transposase